MTRQPTTLEQRERRAQEMRDKRSADQVAEDAAVDNMIKRSIEEHGP